MNDMKDFEISINTKKSKELYLMLEEITSGRQLTKTYQLVDFLTSKQYKASLLSSRYRHFINYIQY